MARKPLPPDEAGQIGVSRRLFLKTAGAGAAISGLEPAGADAAPSVLGPGPVPLALRVNGAPCTVTVEPRTTLLSALRDHLGLTGAKQICDRGSCGGCTVLLDGEPVLGCMMLAADAVGHDVTTIEGMGTPDKMNPLQKAFVEADALQCGFCTPGFIVSGTALLRKNPDPTLAEIKHGLEGNLCRCGTYSRIFEAVQKAATEMKSGRG